MYLCSAALGSRQSGPDESLKDLPPHVGGDKEGPCPPGPPYGWRSKMPGTWQRDGAALSLTVGTFLEGGVLDEQGRGQGTIVLGVKDVGKNHGGAATVEAKFLGCSDPHYLWWMEKGVGQELSDRAWYHLCGARPGECGNPRGKAKMIHLTKVRELNPGDFEESILPFLRKKEHGESFDANLGQFNRWLERRGKGTPAGAASAKGPEAMAKWHGSDSSEGEGKVSRSESPQAKKMRDRLEALRKELRQAEKQAEDYRDKKKKAKRRSRSPPEKDGKKKKTRKRRRSTNRSRSRRKKSPSTRGRSRSRKKKSSHRDRSRTRQRKRRKKDTESSDSGMTEILDKKEELFKNKKRGGSRSPVAGDRGPFGEGPAVDYKDEEETDSDESDFRKAPSGTAKSSQLKLLSYSRRHPGRLASRMLLKMAKTSARGLEGASRSKTPAVAMHHLLTVLQPSLQGKLGMRTLREMKTLAQCLDLLAEGEVGRSADLISQRVKALERATVEGHWNSAQFLELLPPENSTLLERDEELYLARETLTEQKIRGYDKGTRPKTWDPPKGGGKGKDVQKGSKGKGKDKKPSDKEEKNA